MAMLTLVPLPRRLLAILMMLALVAGVFGRVGAAWTCEGRVCSPDLLRCCCESAREVRDGSCVTTGAKGVPGGCAAQCGCEATVTKAADPHLFSPHAFVFAAFEDAPALPPVVFVAAHYALLPTPQVRAMPPPESLRDPAPLERASLRAPPSATA